MLDDNTVTPLRDKGSNKSNITAREVGEADARCRRDEFLATLGHELRNPLMPIRNALDILARADSRESAEKARGIMIRQVDRMTRLIDDLLDVSRIGQGKLNVGTTRLELQRVAESAIEVAQPMITANTQQLKLTVSPRPIHVDGDLTRLEQILTNLLTNASRYTPAGGSIWLTVQAEAGEAVIRVRDDGIGIEADKIDGIFDMFSQGRAGHNRAGLGIGLTLARELVELHGGRIGASSDGAGRGSEFVVRLPTAAEEPEDSMRQPSDHEDGGEPRRVLIVDDNHDVADSLGMMIELLNCRVQTAYDGFAALSAAADLQPHIIFIDVEMPELDGYEVARRLRTRPGHQHTPLIAMTGWDNPRHKERAREAGFNRYFVKPADPAEIEALLAELPETPREPSAGANEERNETG